MLFSLIFSHSPSGLPVLPSELYYERTVLMRLRGACPEDAPVPVHRLGVATSGVLLCGTTDASRSALSSMLQKGGALQKGGRITKRYRALVQGIVERTSFEVLQLPPPNNTPPIKKNQLGPPPISPPLPITTPPLDYDPPPNYDPLDYTHPITPPNHTLYYTLNDPPPSLFLKVSAPIGPVPHASWGGRSKSSHSLPLSPHMPDPMYARAPFSAYTSPDAILGQSLLTLSHCFPHTSHLPCFCVYLTPMLFFCPLSVYGAVADASSKGAKESLSMVRVLRRNTEANETLVEVTIPTGRPHQVVTPLPPPPPFT